MDTQNCDAHPLLSQFHKSERDKEGKTLPPELRSKNVGNSNNAREGRTNAG
jgi:hypothetical protein